MNYAEYKGFLDPDADRERVKSPYNGHQLTQALFYEMNDKPEKYEPLYSMRDYENGGYPSAYQIYMNSVDETEAALKLVGSLRHWRRLCGLSWFMSGDYQGGFEGLAQWREDMKARDISLAKGVLLANTLAGDSPSAQKLINHAKGQKRPDRKDKKDKPTKLTEAEQKIVELHSKINDGS